MANEQRNATKFRSVDLMGKRFKAKPIICDLALLGTETVTKDARGQVNHQVKDVSDHLGGSRQCGLVL